MATWPETPRPVYPLIVTPRWDTLVSARMDAGAEQRRQKTLFPLYDVEVHYNLLDNAGARILHSFFMARRGRLEAFYIYDLALLAAEAFAHVDQYMGVGDGVTTACDIPGRSTSSQKIYIDGYEQTLSTHYSISAGTGVSGADRAVFVTPPADGAVITADFTGFLRMRVRFADDSLPRELVKRARYRFAVQLTGVSEYAT